MSKNVMKIHVSYIQFLTENSLDSQIKVFFFNYKKENDSTESDNGW